MMEWPRNEHLFLFFNAREKYMTFLECPSVLTFEINDYFAEGGDKESERTGPTTVNQFELSI